VDLWVNKFIARVIKGGVLVVGGWVFVGGTADKSSKQLQQHEVLRRTKRKAPALCKL